jgi:hypothetical protein
MWRRGIRDAVFPQGTWWMKRHHGAKVEAVPEVPAGKEIELHVWHPLA